MVLRAVGVSGRGGNAAVENLLEVSTFGTCRVGATVFCLGMGASAEGTDGGVLAAGFDVAKPLTVITLLRGGRGVGSLNDKVATKNWNLGEIGQGPPLIGRHLHHDGKGFLVAEAGIPLGVEETSFGDKYRLGIKDGRLKKVTQGGIIFVVGLDRKSIDGELKVSRGESEGEPGVVADWKGLVKIVGSCVKKGCIGGSWDGGVNNGEGACTIIVNKNLEADRQGGVSSLKTEAAWSGQRMRGRSRSGRGAGLFLGA